MTTERVAARQRRPHARGHAREQINDQAPACPACAAAQAAAAALFRQAEDLGGAAEDFSWLDNGASRLCNTHARDLAARPAAARRFAAAHLRANLERITAGNAASGRRGWRGRPGPEGIAAPAAVCPFCAAMAAAAARVLEAHARDDADETALWCLPHLCDTLGLVRGRGHVRAVAQHAVAHFQALEEELSELIRKSDYRFRDEPRGDEATSWLRAARLTAGAPGVRWALRREPRLEG